MARAQTTLLDLAGEPDERFAEVCDVVGDVNGDGFGDVLVSSSVASNGELYWAGRVTVFSGADGSPLATLRGRQNVDRLGYAASAVGDVNGDGRGDFCASALGGPIVFRVIVASGADGSVLHELTGPASDWFGRACVGVGDADGDGFGDVLVASPDHLDADRRRSGQLTLFSGADGSVLHRVYGDLAEAGLGQAVGRVGDVDGDGRADFAGVGPDAVHVFSGATGMELWSRAIGENEVAVSGGIDADADGFDDVLIGAWRVAEERGRVQLVSGRDNSLLLEVFGTASGDGLGASLAGAGDLDADGHEDFAAGLPGFHGAAGAATGAVRAYSGRTGAVLSTVEGGAGGDALGWTVGGGRDVNGDGVMDAIVGSVTSAKAKVAGFLPRGLAPFGTGTAGCRGTSTLLANDVPTPGNAEFALRATNVGAAPLLLIGDAENAAGSLLYGSLFHIDFAPPAPAQGLVFRTRLPAPDANGSLVAPLPIPALPALLGGTFVFQVASLFPPGSCAHRLTTSRGLRVTMQ